MAAVDLPPHATGNRLLSLDVLRGLTVAGMILVTDPGTYSAVYRPLSHAQWENPTATDMIFPSFLVIVGIAMTLSFAARLRRGETRRQLLLHVLKRSLTLIVLGLIVNGFPDYNLHTIRIPGILQRIALCYFLGSMLYLIPVSMLYLPASPRTEEDPTQPSRRRAYVIAGSVVALLALYWGLLKLVPVPGFGAGRLDSVGNLGAYIDRGIFGIPHLWPYGTTPGYGVTFDPDGLLSTLSALATLLLGVLAGEWLLTRRSQAKKATGLALAAASLILISLALSPFMPLIKKIWTSTFALFSGGVALLLFSFLYILLDIKHWRRWTTPALVFGTNAILAFTLSGILTTLTDRIHVATVGGAPQTLHKWAYLHLFAAWLSPVNASLAYAITIVALNLAILAPLYRRRIFLRL